MKPIMSHYYSHINIDLQKALHGQEAVYFLNVHVFPVVFKSGSMSNNLNIIFLKIDQSCNFILKLVMMFSLLNTDCRVDLPNFIPSYPIIADKGLEYIYKYQNLAALNQ